MVDRAILASKVATVHDAVERVNAVLPATKAAFLADRTAREVVVLNLFVAVQTCLELAAHWVADEGWEVPPRYPDIFVVLADRGVIARDLALRLAAASGFRNLVAHQYGVLDWSRVYAIAASELDDLEAFCATLAARAG